MKLHIYSDHRRTQLASVNRFCMKLRYTSGFTLIEMSVVLVIVGLIIGGIMLARTLLTASQLQTVLTDADSYITAAASFKQQYLALPGDMPTATALWGTDSNGCNYGGGPSGTCSGNGDGQIGPTGYEYESFRFWQHLYYAGLFNQHLSGVASSGGVYAATIGTNVPAGSIGGSGFSVVFVHSSAATPSSIYYATTYGNLLLFGGASNSFLTSSPILTADQAASLDGKIDDGLPATGKVTSFTVAPASYAPSCVTSIANQTYNVSASDRLCSLIFLTNL
jgi:prepilin-type N-terminal cleavage/methylation domain-containing protein